MPTQTASAPPCTRRPGATDTACRCSPECRDIANTARRARALRQKNGTNKRIAAHHVTRHIDLYLQTNPLLTPTHLARAAGIPRRTLARVIALTKENPNRGIPRHTALAILSVPIPTRPDPTMRVPRAGSRRRVEALAVNGWPLKDIARAAGVGSSTLTRRPYSYWIDADTATAVHRIYDQLRYRIGPSEVTRSLARRHGFLPMSAWDRNIDDPEAIPDLSMVENVAWRAAIRAAHPDLVVAPRARARRPRARAS